MRKCFTSAVGAMLISLSFTEAGRAATLYSQSFDNTSGTNVSVSNYGYTAYRSATATDITTTPADAATNGSMAVGSAAGNPSPPTGYLFATAGNTNQLPFSAVHLFAGGLTVPNGSAVSFTMGNTNTNGQVRLLFQLGGDGSVNSGSWYASGGAGFQSNPAYASAASFAAAPTASVTYSFAFDVTQAAFRNFTLVPGSTMAIGSTTPTTMNSNTITGIGFFINTGFLQQSVRLDSLAVNEVPEPTAFLASILAGAGYLGLRRTRASATK